MDKLKQKITNEFDNTRSIRTSIRDQRTTTSVKKGRHISPSSKPSKKYEKQTKLLANKENMVISNNKNASHTYSLGSSDSHNGSHVLKGFDRVPSLDHSGSIDSLDQVSNSSDCTNSNTYTVAMEEKVSPKMNIFNMGIETLQVNGAQSTGRSSDKNVSKLDKKRPTKKLHLYCNMNNSYHGSTGKSLFDEELDTSEGLKRSSSDPSLETFPNGEVVADTAQDLTKNLTHEHFVGTREKWGPLKKHDSFEVLEDWCNRSLRKTESGGIMGKDCDKNYFSDLIEYVEENGLAICGSLGQSEVADELQYVDSEDKGINGGKDSFEMLEEWCQMKEGEIEIKPKYEDNNARFVDNKHGSVIHYNHKNVLDEQVGTLDCNSPSNLVSNKTESVAESVIVSPTTASNCETNVVSDTACSVKQSNLETKSVDKCTKEQNDSLAMTNCLIDSLIPAKNETTVEETDAQNCESKSTHNQDYSEQDENTEQSVQNDLTSSYVCIRSNKIIDCSKRKIILDNASTDCDESLSVDSLDNAERKSNVEKAVINQVVHEPCVAVSTSAPVRAAVTDSKIVPGMENQCQPYLPVPVVFRETNFIPSPKMVKKLTKSGGLFNNVHNVNKAHVSEADSQESLNTQGKKSVLNDFKLTHNGLKCDKHSSRDKIVFHEPYFSMGALNTGHVVSDYSPSLTSSSGSGDCDSCSLCSVTSGVTDDFSWSDIDSLKSETFSKDELSDETASSTKSNAENESLTYELGQGDQAQNKIQSSLTKGSNISVQKSRKITGVRYNTDYQNHQNLNNQEVTYIASGNGIKAKTSPRFKATKHSPSYDGRKKQLRKAISSPSLGVRSGLQQVALPIYRTGTPRYAGKSVTGQSSIDIRTEQLPGISFDCLEDEDTDSSEASQAHIDILLKKKQQMEVLTEEKKKLKLKIIALKQPRQLRPARHSSSSASPGSPQTFARFNNIHAISLAGAELEAVTNLYTLCNGQQQAKIIKKATAPMIVKLVPDVKEATRVTWVSDKDLAQSQPESVHQPSTDIELKPSKSILKTRDLTSPYPFGEELHSPVVVRKLAKKSSSAEQMDPSKM